MDMKSTKFLAVMVLGLGLVAGASAKSTNTIDTYVIGQNVQGELTTEATVSHDYYYEDFDVTQVYGQWAVLDITDVDADDPTNLSADEIDRASIVESGDWQDLQDTGEITGDSFADYGANDTATEAVSYSHNFDLESPDTGEYALLTVMATADSVYDADANQTSGEGWSQSSAEWSVPSDETYDYEEESYGINEVDRTTYSFQVVEAEEPSGVGSALGGFFDDIFGGIVEAITGFFDSGELGVPDPENPPSP